MCYPGCLRCVCVQASSFPLLVLKSTRRLAGFAHVHIHTVLIVAYAAVGQQGRREGQVVFIHNQSNQVIAFLTN